MPGIKKCNKELLYKVHQVLRSVAINRVCLNTGKVVFSQVIKFQILKILIKFERLQRLTLKSIVKQKSHNIFKKIFL